MFIPVDFPIRGLMASMAAFDLVGMVGVDYGLGISHVGHLGFFFFFFLSPHPPFSLSRSFSFSTRPSLFLRCRAQDG
jgi:hypothetical protein